jgi:hypothetical protein
MLHSSYTETGVAVVTGEFQGGTSTIVVHMFGLPAGAAAPTESQPAVQAETATPSPTPLPSPSPPPVPVDTTPPRVPRIALAGPTTVQQQASLLVTGEPGSTIFFLVNNQPQGSIVLPASGQTNSELSLGNLPDGTLVLRAYATDSAQNQSDSSTALAVVKDTLGPQLASDAISFIVSPTTDEPRVLVTVATDDQVVEISQGEQQHTFQISDPIVLPFTSEALTLAVRDAAGNVSARHDVSLDPSYAINPDQVPFDSTAEFRRTTRLITAIIFIILLVLLSLTVLIKFRVQRATVISHASLVLLLAAFLFML